MEKNKNHYFKKQSLKYLITFILPNSILLVLSFEKSRTWFFSLFINSTIQFFSIAIPILIIFIVAIIAPATLFYYKGYKIFNDELYLRQIVASSQSLINTKNNDYETKFELIKNNKTCDFFMDLLQPKEHKKALLDAFVGSIKSICNDDTITGSVFPVEHISDKNIYSIIPHFDNILRMQNIDLTNINIEHAKNPTSTAHYLLNNHNKEEIYIISNTRRKNQKYYKGNSTLGSLICYVIRKNNIPIYLVNISSKNANAFLKKYKDYYSQLLTEFKLRFILEDSIDKMKSIHDIGGKKNGDPKIQSCRYRTTKSKIYKRV